ncbi:MAG: hypothetical protein KatS3mg113_0291 [Planctomycetaceae bacterium]|nr:MAG: hypothetical protein KatS3mg113_0291 [Planctomycetaceae bacterium]
MSWHQRRKPERSQRSITGRCIPGWLATITLVSIAWAPTCWGQTQAINPPPSADPPFQPAEEYLRQARLSLQQRQSVRAEVKELVHLSDPPFHLKGLYFSSGNKMRMFFEVKLPGGTTGSLLEVCDGDRLWSEIALPRQKKVTRRDLRQILEAIETHRERPEAAINVDLALGGLPGLLASVARNMTFHVLKDDTLEGRPVIYIEGTWKPEWRQRFGAQTPEDRLPETIPDRLRIFFNPDTSFPERLLYLKRLPDREAFRPLLDLQFRNVELDEPVNDTLFEYTPPQGITPIDVTKQYLEQLFPPVDRKAPENPLSDPLLNAQ